MRRKTVLGVGLAIALGVGCRYQDRQPAQQPPPTQGYAYPPPPGYYPPQPPPGYYPPPQQPGYYPPPQPTQPQPRPQPQPTTPAPAPQPTQPPQQPYNPWLAALGQLLNGGAPPAPSPTPTVPPPAPTTPPAPPAPTISPRALDLANAINRYRAQNGLPAIPISKSLSYVAETHVKDLHDSPKLATNCNGHSWSSKGAWTPCCYTPDHAQAKCMWQKPAELTQLKGTGFEITLGQPGEQNAGLALDSQKAVAAWQGSPLHNEVILNRGTWQNMTWRSMGAGIIDSHACAWFSDQADPTQ
jgi:uncharacterized protein YkwD